MHMRVVVVVVVLVADVEVPVVVVVALVVETVLVVLVVVHTPHKPGHAVRASSRAIPSPLQCCPWSENVHRSPPGSATP